MKYSRHQEMKLLEDIEKIFDEYCKEFKINDLDFFNHFMITRDCKNKPSSENNVMHNLRLFIEFKHPIIFKIIDQKRKCEILEIFLMDNCWSLNRLDWKKRKSSL